MTTFITTAVLGAFIAVIGIVNMTGNISTLHWYHRQRVTEEDRLPFGRLVGAGTLTVGVALIVFGAMFLISEVTGALFLVPVGAALLIAGIGAGLGISLYAMIKYNKGIF